MVAGFTILAALTATASVGSATAPTTHSYSALTYVSTNYVLTVAQKATLATEAGTIASATPTSVTVSGYTDSSGTAVQNVRLSWLRANTALEQLRHDVRGDGDTTTKFIAKGMGATTKFGAFANNRRVTIISTGGSLTATLTGWVVWNDGQWPNPPFTIGAAGSSLFKIEVQVNGQWYANATLSNVISEMRVAFSFSIPNVPLTNGGATIALVENDGPNPINIATGNDEYCGGASTSQGSTSLTPTAWTDSTIPGIPVSYQGDASQTIPGVTVSADANPVSIDIGYSASWC